MLEALLDRAVVRKAAARWFSRGVVDAVRETVKQLKKLIEGYDGPKAFEADWKWIRLTVPLQFRLLVEQILWDKRGGWRDLVTGFGPVKGRSNGRRARSGSSGRR